MSLRLLFAFSLLLTSNGCKSALGGSCTANGDCSSGYCLYNPDGACSQSNCSGTCECPPSGEPDGGTCD